jgi:hypothetical protein
MTPWQQFRLWLHEGPLPEKLMTGVASGLVLALVAWASVPAMQSDGSTPIAAAGATLPPATPDAGPASVAPSGDAVIPSAAAVPTASVSAGPSAPLAPSTAPLGAVGPQPPSGPRTSTPPGKRPGSATTTTAGPTRASTAAASTAAPCPVGATDVGVTPQTITVGVIIYSLGAANSLINLPSTQDWQKAYDAVFSDANAKGGAACRKLVPRYYIDNPVDSNSEHSMCLQMVQDKIFALLNNPFSTSEQTCPAKQHIPNIWATPPHTPDVRQYAPYILSWQGDFDKLIHLYIRGAQADGWFNGMKKLGILEQTCYPDENTDIVNELKAIGIDPGQASVFNYGCTGNPTDPQSDQQGVLQFKTAGVTHVLNVAYAFDATFSAVADQQNYHPKFAHMEDASAQAIESGTTKPGNSYDGTLLIESIPTGAVNTPGYRWNQTTDDCVKAMARVGLPSPEKEPVAKYYGLACADVETLVAAVAHAPALQRTQLGIGLSRSGVVELSYPAGPLGVTDAAVPTGGQVYEPAQWYTSCQCWRITEARWRSP